MWNAADKLSKMKLKFEHATWWSFFVLDKSCLGMTKVKCLTGVVSGKDEGENLKIAKFSHTLKLLLFFFFL